jgi:hypothetical protein
MRRGRAKDDKFSLLADMISVDSPSFDDDVIANNDDEDLRNDLVS